MMEKQLPVAAKLLPKYLNLNSIGYGCTSASTIIGERRVKEIINKFHPNIPSSNPLSAAKAAFKVLNRISHTIYDLGHKFINPISRHLT